MIDRQELLKDLQALLRTLEADLLERSESAEVPEVSAALSEEYEKAKEAERTAQNYEDWRSDYVTQIAAAWVLSCVFARFLEDNQLVDPPKLAGPGSRLDRARDEHTMFFQDSERATQTDREYLLHVFGELATLPGAKEVFGKHNPVWELPNWFSGDAAGELLRFFQRINAETGTLVHDFTDPEWETRFLGDLYQDLSEAARKKYALLQTPEFVEEFILERTLDAAINEFGLDGFRMIDPACGSGHFLLGSFRRLLQRWQRNDPGINVRVLAQRALESVHGVDVNPYAVAIARFRLFLAALKLCEVTRLAHAPAFQYNLTCGDSLLHGLPGGDQLSLGWSDFDHVYMSESLQELRRIIRPAHYHAVVANPPYITVKDKALNRAYRERYSTCYRTYSLAAPFMQRLFSLAVSGGFTGQITTNSFMKREYGKNVVEHFIPKIEITHVIDSAGAFIPGHATPTVILFGRNRRPVSNTVRLVAGIRGEPTAPSDPAKGQVWLSIVNQIDSPTSSNEFVTVSDSNREGFHRHPWNIGGGGAAELKRTLDESAQLTLSDLADAIGRTTVVGEDDVYILDLAGARRLRVRQLASPLVIGDRVRDWEVSELPSVIYPYMQLGGEPIPSHSEIVTAYFWRFRTSLKARSVFGKTLAAMHRPWYEHLEHYRDKLRSPLSIAFPFVASHNHFRVFRGGTLFNRSAPVVKLRTNCSEDDYLRLTAFLNSSSACFWMKQVSQQKQMTGGETIRIAAISKVPYEFAATQLQKIPIPKRFEEPVLGARLLVLAKSADRMGQRLSELNARAVIDSALSAGHSIVKLWSESDEERKLIRSNLILVQEEIDFVVYEMFGLLPEAPLLTECEFDAVLIEAGQRPFEVFQGSNQDGFEVAAEIPTDWPGPLRETWQKRLELLGSLPELRIIENAHYKRRWIGRQGKYNRAVQADDLPEAAKSWLIDRLERHFDFDGRMNDEGHVTAKVNIALISIGQLADVARHDANFMQVGELYRDDPAFDVQRLVDELVADESVPLLPVLCYKPAGLRKRAEWKTTWELQRVEDAIDARTRLPADDPNHLTEIDAEAVNRREVGDIPVPPKYKSSDFISTGGARYWALRGKLDAPKERWVSFPHCEGEDGTPMIAWAGYDHLQLARAISAYYVDVQERLGGRDDPRLTPLLACLIELLPWLKQWHNEIDPEFGMAMGDYFEGFIQEEARQLGKTVDEVEAWQPPKKTRKKTGRKKKVAE